SWPALRNRRGLGGGQEHPRHALLVPREDGPHVAAVLLQGVEERLPRVLVVDGWEVGDGGLDAMLHADSRPWNAPTAPARGNARAGTRTRIHGFGDRAHSQLTPSPGPGRRV